MRRLWRDRVFVISIVVAAVGVLIGAVLSLNGGGVRAPVAGRVVELQDVDALRDVIGERVSAQGARVQSVPADEGFWVTDGGDRVWVQIRTTGESPFAVESGAQISFVGQVVAHGSDFVDRPDFPAADASELIGAGAHIEVDVKDVRLG